MDKPMTFNEWMGKQGNLALIHANCCRIAYEAGQQSKQAKVEELKKTISEMAQSYRVEAHELGRIRDFEKSQMYSHFANQLEHLLKGGA
ncbi:hypothetical protein PX039_14880 [Acinetobacter baumannii]|uniref:hypothetical protein n=1 Tax=Acinetobacter baumannii TaxID=470 RepID=UPI0019D019CD|nr:hypothetical protein [Acinetobacter baumannii]MDO5888007.1 hypothetical protein [Acinetobacter baumannii]HCM9404751.1 hypothetical protein [Acinetobacter baumannii]HCT9317324.1 hypothetical protein [Acinetobacter baumannii]HCU0789653.1 hypothetical protein [Acinetobacter baumannii]HEC0062319.1 hypothetical protein [Acinetobacter baumannii]